MTATEAAVPEAHGSERGGSPSVEAAVLAAVLGLLITFAIAGGRLVSAEAAADHAARAAARVASLQRDPAEADTAATDAALSSLTGQGLHCAGLTVEIDTSGFAGPLGAPAAVTATVRCAVTWSDLGLPGGGGPTVQAHAVSALDRWRERT